LRRIDAALAKHPAKRQSAKRIDTRMKIIDAKKGFLSPRDYRTGKLFPMSEEVAVIKVVAVMTLLPRNRYNPSPTI